MATVKSPNTGEMGRRYERTIRTWCVSGPSGSSTPPNPGPCWRVVGFGMASDGTRGVYATIIFEREYEEAADVE